MTEPAGQVTAAGATAPPSSRRRPPLQMPAWLDWARRAVALAVALAGTVAVGAGKVSVCSDVVTTTGRVVRVCRPPQFTDGLVVAGLVVVILLLLPDLGEIGLPGMFSLRRTVEEQDSRLENEEARRELLETEVNALSTQVLQAVSAKAVGVDALNIYVSGDETADYAAAEVPPSRIGALTARRAERVEVERVSRARYTAADLFVRRLRSDPGGALSGSSLHLYLPDETGLALLPVFESDREAGAGEGWRSGQGIVGRAWRDGEGLTARGAEIGAGIADLPVERRQRYAALAVIAAVPVLNASDRPVAVLSASSTDPASHLDGSDGIEALVTHADALARVIVDLLGWASDLE